MTQATDMVKVTSYIIYGKEWEIVHCEAGFKNDTEGRHYAGIRREWITDGKLNRELNGIQMCVSHSVQEVIDRITQAETLDHYISEGMTIEEACMAYFMKKQEEV